MALCVLAGAPASAEASAQEPVASAQATAPHLRAPLAKSRLNASNGRGSYVSNRASTRNTDIDTPRSPARLRTYIAPFYATAIFDRIRGSGVGTGQILEAQIDGRLREGRLDDVVAGISAGLEHRLGNYVIGIDASFRYRTDWDLTAPTPSIQSITNIFSNVQTTSSIVYIARTWQRGASRFSIGGGAGAAFSRVESEYIEREVPGIRPEQRFESQARNVDLSWAGFAKWNYPISRRWEIGLGYRYTDLGTLQTADFVFRPGEFATKHTSHDLILSFDRRVY